MLLLKPARLRQCLLPQALQLIHAAAKPRIGKQPLDVLARGSPQHGPWIVCELPEDRVERLPDLLAHVIARAAQIEREPGEHPESLHIVRQRPEKAAAGFRLVAHFWAVTPSRGTRPAV